MIAFHSNTDFVFNETSKYTEWINKVVRNYEAMPGTLQYVFMSDEELLAMNQKFLQHDYYTDIITFDYSEGMKISGDIFISVDRVGENAEAFKVTFEEELRRVMIHGVLHLLGMKDSTDADRNKMREAEEEAMKLFHVKH